MCIRDRLEADVALPVTKEFISNVKPKAIGQEIIKSTSPGQMIVKIVYDELVNILGSKNEEINLKAVPPVSILLVGLQGSGKTTSAAKLAKLIEKNHKKKVMLVSLDVYRPAAQEQLKLLSEKNNFRVWIADQESNLKCLVGFIETRWRSLLQRQRVVSSGQLG